MRKQAYWKESFSARFQPAEAGQQNRRRLFISQGDFVSDILIGDRIISAFHGDVIIKLDGGDFSCRQFIGMFRQRKKLFLPQDRDNPGRDYADTSFHTYLVFWRPYPGRQYGSSVIGQFLIGLVNNRFLTAFLRTCTTVFREHPHALPMSCLWISGLLSLRISR
jgi:hypothetical protein